MRDYLRRSRSYWLAESVAATKPRVTVIENSWWYGRIEIGETGTVVGRTNVGTGVLAVVELDSGKYAQISAGSVEEIR